MIEMKHSFKIIILFYLFLITIPSATHAQPNDRFIDNGDETITDSATGLMWRKSTPSPLIKPAVTWFKAVKECKELRLGNYSDWRLPTSEEWMTIIDANNEYPALVTMNPFQNVIVSGPYWTGTEYTYGAYPCDEYGCPVYAHVVLLYLGYLGHQRKDKTAFTWPVRSTIEIVKVPQKLTSKKPSAQKKMDKKALVKPQFLEEVDVEKVLVPQILLSNNFQLLGFNKEEQIDLGYYLQLPIQKESRVKIRSGDDGIETIFNLYGVNSRLVDLFNNNAEIFGLSIRGKIDLKNRHLVFYENIP